MIPTRREIERELVDICERDGIAIDEDATGDKVLTEYRFANLTILATELHRWLKDRQS